MATALRQDLALLPLDPEPDGTPVWVLHDPVVNRFFRLGPADVAVLGALGAGDPAAIAAAASAHLERPVAAGQVETFLGFLAGHELLRAEGDQARGRLLARAQAGRKHWLVWLLKNYLFVKLPLVRPDRFLDATVGLVGWAFHPAAGWTVAALAALAMVLTLRQWDHFLHEFGYFTTIEGLTWFGAALGGLKLAHELGHAYTAKRFGCHVPTMGVALLVMWPVLFTDTTDAWRLASRRRRLAIGAAGMAVELALASLALLVWNVLPDGPARGAAFMVATTAWVLTLLVNLNPLMRFDGYFLLSDWLEVENLQERAFALARWVVREGLFGWGEPPPEPPRRVLVLYALSVWVYRFFLFLGIAVVVYHYFFKVLGLMLFAVEIVYFILLPIGRELAVWAMRWRQMRFNLHTAATVTVLGGMVAGVMVPWSGRLSVPAYRHAAESLEVIAPAAGIVADMPAAPGERRAAGAPLVVLDSPELSFDIRTTGLEVERLGWQVSAQGVSPAFREQAQVVRAELASARERLASSERERSRLTLSAPFAGRIDDLAPAVRPGAWVAKGERLLLLHAPESAVVVAYVYEEDRDRVRPGLSALFHPDEPDLPSVALHVAEVEAYGLRELEEPFQASTLGGAVPVRKDADGRLVPVRAVYRVRLVPDTVETVPWVVTGSVVLDLAPQSLAARIWRQVKAVAVRETGF